MSFDTHSRKLHIGLKTNKTTIISITDEGFVAMCECGTKMTRRHTQPIPFMCKACAKSVFNNGAQSPTREKSVVRDNTRWENMQIKEFLRKRKCQK